MQTLVMVAKEPSLVTEKRLSGLLHKIIAFLELLFHVLQMYFVAEKRNAAITS